MLQYMITSEIDTSDMHFIDLQILPLSPVLVGGIWGQNYMIACVGILCIHILCFALLA